LLHFYSTYILENSSLEANTLLAAMDGNTPKGSFDPQGKEHTIVWLVEGVSRIPWWENYEKISWRGRAALLVQSAVRWSVVVYSGPPRQGRCLL